MLGYGHHSIHDAENGVEDVLNHIQYLVTEGKEYVQKQPQKYKHYYRKQDIKL